MLRKQRKLQPWRRFGCVILIIIKFGELLLWFSPRIINGLRSYIKHSKGCLIRYPNTLKLVKKKNSAAPRFFNHFSVFRYRVKHSSSCLIYYFKQREPDLEILQNKQLYTKIIFLVSLIALWIFRWLNAVSFFLVFQGFRAHFRFVDPTAMPLCSISLLYCVFPICGITHLLKKVKKGKFALKLGLAGLKWNHHIYDIISFLEIVFHLPDTPSFSFFTVYLTTPFFSISPSSPSPPPHFLPKYFHHLSHGYPPSVFVTRYLQLPFPSQVSIPLTS